MNPSLVESHDDALDVAALAEELVELLLGRVVGEVADVQRIALPQQLLLLVPGPLQDDDKNLQSVVVTHNHEELFFCTTFFCPNTINFSRFSSKQEKQ